jgi:hypothetical protein
MNLPARKWFLIGLGIIAANLVGLIFVLAFSLLRWVAAQKDQSITASPAGTIFIVAIWPSLVVVPMAMGIAAAYFWRSLSFRIWQYLLWWTVAALITPLGAYFLMQEGGVCLIIGFPLVFVCGFAGVMLGRVIFCYNTQAANVNVIPLLLVITLAEGHARHDQRNVVEDRIQVRAPIEQIWRYVVSFPRIDTPPTYWLNDLGLPSPLETTCEGPFVGAHRECIFTDGLVFKETVSEIVPRRLLTFEIVEQPRNPELLGHLTLHRGQFELVDNKDGTTTLVGRSWYTLHMRPIWYFDWWTRDVTSHVHLRVMEHIKTLSEQ